MNIRDNTLNVSGKLRNAVVRATKKAKLIHSGVPPYISTMKKHKEVYVEGTLNLEQLKVLVEYFEEEL